MEGGPSLCPHPGVAGDVRAAADVDAARRLDATGGRADVLASGRWQHDDENVTAYRALHLLP